MSNKAIVIGLPLVALTLVWFVLAPLELGGTTTCVITRGVSMQPGFHTGDLAILRVSGAYQVGDIVAYRDPQIGRVMHRIVGEDGGLFVMKGDNNDFVDPYEPARSDIVGKLWVHLPGVGKWLQAVQQPMAAAMVATMAGMLLFAPIGADQQRRRRLGRRDAGSGKRHDGTGPVMTSTGILGPIGQLAASVVVVLALLSLLLGTLAFTRPFARNSTGLLGYQQNGSFNYSAQAPGGVYDGDTATTGQPIFRELADKVDLRFDYAFSSDAAAVVHGEYQLDAVLSRADGWSRSILLVPQTSFTGPQATVSSTLDLGQLQTLIGALDQATNPQYRQTEQFTVTIVPVIHLTGTVAAVPMNDQFSPTLKFDLDPVELQLDQSGDPAAQANPLKPSEDGTVRVSRLAPNRLPVPVLHPTVAAARKLSAVGMVAALLGGIILAALAWRARQADEPAQINARYGSLMVTLLESDLGASRRIIDVASINDLVRVAEREGRMILHECSGRAHDYFVQDVDVTYRYCTFAGDIESVPSTVKAVT